MQIFSMDTSSAAASCALLEDDRPIAQFYTDARLTHSQTADSVAIKTDIYQTFNRNIT